MKIGRKGSSYVFVLNAFIIVSIFSVTILSLYMNNLKEIKYHQDGMEAYYLAFTGVELAYTALMKPDPDRELQVPPKNLSDQLVDGLRDEWKEENIEYGKGKITVVSKMTEEINFAGWVEINSTAKLDRNGREVTRKMYFDPHNPLDTVWGR